MELKTVQTDDKPRRYFINGVRVSREKYEDAKAARTLCNFRTRLEPTKQGDRIIQTCTAY